MSSLTKDDIKAMKQADRVCFYLTKNPAYPKGSGSAGKILLIVEAEQDGVFESHERQRAIETAGTLPGWASRAFAMTYTFRCGQHGNQAWRAICLLVREGDELTIYAEENDNDYIRAAMIPAGKLGADHPGGYDSLHADHLCVSIRRNGNFVLAGLQVSSSCCPNNSARMIQ